MSAQTYLAIDPGETIGWATFDENGLATGYGEVKGRPALLDWLKTTSGVRQVIIEDYRIFGHKAKAHALSKVETTRVIGAVEAWAQLQDEPPKIALQPSSILPIAEKWSGFKVPGHGVRGHDKWSAYNHGYYWLVSNKIVTLKPLELG